MTLRGRSRSQQTESVDFLIRDYRAADFDILWTIDQACFQPGIAYTQMDLTGFVSRRKAITRVAARPASLLRYRRTLTR